MKNITSRRKYIDNYYNWKNKETFNSFNYPDYNTLKENIIKHSENIFTFPILSKEILSKIKEEAINFSNSGLPIISPNPSSTKIDYGSCILNEFAKKEISNLIITLIPALEQLFPKVGKISDTDFLAFLVRFDGENHSEIHADESHLTVSICLSDSFEGGEFVFKSSQLNKEKINSNDNSNDIKTSNKIKSQLEVKQTPFHALAFRGSLPHYTNDTKGERYNLILYLRQENNLINNFYEGEYLEYLSNAGIRNVEIGDSDNNSDKINKKGISFSIPSLPGLRV